MKAKSPPERGLSKGETLSYKRRVWAEIKSLNRVVSILGKKEGF